MTKGMDHPKFKASQGRFKRDRKAAVEAGKKQKRTKSLKTAFKRVLDSVPPKALHEHIQEFIGENQDLRNDDVLALVTFKKAVVEGDMKAVKIFADMFVPKEVKVDIEDKPDLSSLSKKELKTLASDYVNDK